MGPRRERRECDTSRAARARERRRPVYKYRDAAAVQFSRSPCDYGRDNNERINARAISPPSMRSSLSDEAIRRVLDDRTTIAVIVD